ncbi:hypothetical protein [Sulfuriferula thiophila]|uniref:hypothetical protein n=1 Tax=Sulfuriferula thiophila TaxID=1781211 RepID=UPI000F613B72|nr:hypothetical protein [Sulfuriferula thiophila]
MSTPIQWTVPLDHPAFAGHFPDIAILPGVVLLDLALQLITDACHLTLQNCTINSVKFLHPTLPGDVLSIVYHQLDNGTIRFDISTPAHKAVSGSVMINSNA